MGSIDQYSTSSSDLEPSFSRNDWLRIRDVWSAITASEEMLQSSSTKLENIVSEDTNYRDFASDVQNRQVRLRSLELRIRETRRFIRTAQYRLGMVSDEQEQKKKSDELLEEKISDDHEEIVANNMRIKETRSTLTRLRNELTFRRKYKLNELYKIFSPGEQPLVNSPAAVFEKRCNCPRLDSIRGLHLPYVVARLGHSETEVCSAVGLTVLLLDCTSQILSVPLKCPVFFYGSRSYIIDRTTGQIHHLFVFSKQRRHKEHLDQTLYLLNEIVVQLRSDCGLVTRERDRALQNLQELILSFTGENSPLSLADPSLLRSSQQPRHSSVASSSVSDKSPPVLFSPALLPNVFTY